ncbi:MAG: hypothetical protein K6C94_05785 [Candidatus Gastranaerophilales bacterium]|nr:hypothetical protein [Candidatus Gastranaerophilales bacterium]
MLELDGTLIVAMISFIVFAFIMNAVFYQPIMKIMDERQAFLAQNEATANNAQNESITISEQKQKELADARTAATKDVSANSEQFKKEQKAEIEKFSKEQKIITENEKIKLVQEAEQAKTEISAGVDDIANIISSKIIGGTNV